MHRDRLIAQILALATSWTAQERGMLRGSWGRKASDQQLAAILARLEADFDAAADATDIEEDELDLTPDWVGMLFTDHLPLGTLPAEPWDARAWAAGESLALLRRVA